MDMGDKDTADSKYKGQGQSLIPNRILQNYMSADVLSKLFWQYVETTTNDVIDTAIVLERNNMLDETNLNSLVSNLNHMTMHPTPDIYPGPTAIVDQILERGLRVTEFECRVTLKLIFALIKKPSFQKANTDSHVFTVLRQIFSWEVPTQKNLEIELNKKPGRAKYYYLKAVLPKVEAAIKRLRKGIFIAGVFYTTNNAHGRQTVANMIAEMKERNERGVNLHEFFVVIGIIIAVQGEKHLWESVSGFQGDDSLMSRVRRRFGLFGNNIEEETHWEEPVGGFKVEKSLMVQLQKRLGEFLSILRAENKEPYELIDYLVEIYDQAFPKVSEEDGDGDFNESIHLSGDKAEKVMLERLYSKLYQQMEMHQGYSNSPPSSSLNITATNEAPNWVKDIEEISTLLHYGLRKRLPKDLMQKVEISKYDAPLTHGYSLDTDSESEIINVESD